MRSVQVRDTGPSGRTRRRGAGQGCDSPCAARIDSAKRWNRLPGIALAEQTHPRTGGPLAHERNDPGETFGGDGAAEMHLHFVERGERNFELSAMDEDARHAETERAIEAVAGAAGEDRRARVDRARAAVRRTNGHRFGRRA